MNLIQNHKVSRIVGLDLIRCFAIFSIIAGHFFEIHTSYRESDLNSFSMFLQAGALQLFYTGVPLFLLMTGYLNAQKTISRKYYRGIWRVLVSYLIFSILTVIFRKFYLHENESIYMWIYKILSYSAIPYAWYIEMWIGLFLITPFLNKLYVSLPSRRQKQLLIVTIFVMTSMAKSWIHVLPQYWMQCFPLLYYFIGCYIREYQPKVNSKYLLIIVFVCCLTNPFFKFLNNPLFSIGGGAYGVFGVILAVTLFLLIYRVDFYIVPLNNILTKISLLSLDIYLCSYIFDAIYYPFFKDHWFINQSQFGMFFFVIVPLVFISSIILAQIKDWMFKISGFDRWLTK